MFQLSDVARMAGVSTASVSRVLNHPEKVSETIRVKVTKAMEELGYVRDGAARDVTPARPDAKSPRAGAHRAAGMTSERPRRRSVTSHPSNQPA